MRTQALDFSVNLLRALLWQHNDAARLQALVQQKQDWYNVENQGFWEAWVRDVFDLRTANDFGLSVWTIILDMPLKIIGGGEGGQDFWGFAADDENFTHGNFTGLASVALDSEALRLVLRLRYFQLVTRGTVPEVNAFLGGLFSDFGPVYAIDGLDMTARYAFGFPLTPDLETVLSNFDLLPRPAGVKVDYVIIPEADGWGFGRFHLNFTNGNFYHA